MLLKIISDFPATANSQRISREQLEAKPFVQWPGGKRALINQYYSYFPKDYDTYYEPFLGGGAVFFYLKPKKAVLSDNNQELIISYEAIRDYPTKVVKILGELKKRHSKKLYEAIRNIDRKVDLFSLTKPEIAARLIYLNQTCFNGIYRVNKKGQFNVPIGSSLNRLICDKQTIFKDHVVLKKASIKLGDFITIINKAKKNDFVYLDPPYFPISIYSDFNRYTKEKFYEKDHIRLKKSIDILTKKGSKVMLSNSNSPFVKNLYKNYRQILVYSNRTINSKKENRGKISELLILNY